MNEPTFDAEHNQIQVSWSSTDEILNGKYYVLLMRKNYYKPVALLASKFSLNDKDAFSFDINPQFIQDGTKYYVAFADKIRNILDARPEVSTKQLICTPILRKPEVSIVIGSIASQIEPQSPATMAAKISQRKAKQAEKNLKKSLKKKKHQVGKKKHAKKNRKHPKKSKKEKKVKQIKAKGIQAINQAENKNDVKRHRSRGLPLSHGTPTVHPIVIVHLGPAAVTHLHATILHLRAVTHSLLPAVTHHP